MKFADTPVKQMKVYLKEQIRNAYGGLEDGDVLQWHNETFRELNSDRLVEIIFVKVKKKVK